MLKKEDKATEKTHIRINSITEIDFDNLPPEYVQQLAKAYAKLLQTGTKVPDCINQEHK